MHIGFDARLVYYQQAGIGQYIINLLSAFAELEEQRPAAGRDRITIFQRNGDELPLAEGAAQTRYNLSTPSHHRLEQPALAWEIGRYHLGHRLDVMHSPDFIQPIWLARLANLPTVVTIHDLAFLRLAHLTLLTAEAKRYYGQVQAAAHTARRVIAVSESTKRDVVELLGVDAAKVAVVHEAANPLFHPVSRQEVRRYITVNLAEKVGEARGFILFVSTIEPRKNLPLLLQAYAALRDHNRTALPNLVVAGREGWLYEEVYDLVRKLGLREQVIFTGGVTTQELLYLYNQAALLACPSFYEGFGLPALEAMACGLPVIAANSSSLPEVVGDAGLLLDPHNPDAWTDALAHLLDDDKLRAELRTKGLQQAHKFSWQQAAEQTLAVYHAAASSLPWGEEETMSNPNPAEQTLIWNQDQGDITLFHLHQGGQEIGTLTVRKDGDSVAQFDSDSLHLRFNHKGFFNHSYHIYDTNNTELAEYEAAVLGSHGLLQLADGRQLGWHKTSFWFRRYAFEVADGTTMLHFDGHGTMRTEVTIDILQPLPGVDLMVLASFGMYLIVDENANATTTVVTVPH